MSDQADHSRTAGAALFIIPPAAEPFVERIEHALAERRPADVELPLLTDVAQGDAFLARQLAALRDGWEVRPPPPRGLLDRIRTRLAWWLLGPEIRQINATHATLTRLADSLVVLIDHERAARRRLEEDGARHMHE